MIGSSSELHDSFHGMNKWSFHGGWLLIILFNLRDAVDDAPHASKKLELLVLLRIDILNVVGNF